MSKCPFCHFENEAGALFCEQCKSDLGWVDPIAAAVAPGKSNGSAAPVFSESPIMAAFADHHGSPAVVAEPIAAEALPIAEASPVYSFVDSGVAEQLNGQHAQPIIEAQSAPAAPVAHEPSFAPPPSTIEQAPPQPAPATLPAESKPKLIVLRGQRQNIEYQIYDGDNYIGRADEKAVDVDLEDQEPPDRVWSSRQHAVISYDGGALSIEDLNSTNGTYLNRTKIESGKKIPLKLNDVIQIGTVQLKIVV